MTKRIERRFIDRLINEKLLKKRQLGLPLKYNFDKPQRDSLFIDKLLFPKNKLDRLLANCYERIMPGIQYFIWNDQVRWAREHGYTLAESFYTHFRHAHTITMHAMAQMVHPYGYLNAQKRDQFIRKIAVLLPGIQAPDWAQENRRVYDLDYNSFMIPFEATREVEREATPAPHSNQPTYTVIHNLFENRFNFGLNAQRLFFNEELRGDFYKTRSLSKSEKDIIHGWYGPDSQKDSQKDRLEGLSDEQRAEYNRNLERWTNNFKEFYPEVFNTLKKNRILHKYDEPYYERNMNDIRGSIFTSKWISAAEKNAFNNEDLNRLHEFFVNNNSAALFSFTENGIEGNETYKKFVSELKFPDILKIDRFISYPPEKQFYDMLDQNWGISFETVDTYKRLYLQMIKDKNTNAEVNALVLEEVYNPLFRKVLSREFNYDLKQTESFCLKALDNGVSIQKLSELAHASSENVAMTSSASLGNMVKSQVREIVKHLN